jgi:hypothetical protein
LAPSIGRNSGSPGSSWKRSRTDFALIVQPS